MIKGIEALPLEPICIYKYKNIIQKNRDNNFIGARGY